MDTSDDVIVEAFDDLGYTLEDPKVIEKLKLFCHQYELNVIELSQQYLKFALKNKCDDPKSEGTLALSHSSFWSWHASFAFQIMAKQLIILSSY